MIAAISMDLFPTICTAVGAGFVFFVGNKDTPEARRSMLGLAAGVMLAASVFSLLQPAIEQASAQGKSGWLAASAGLVLAAAGLLLMEQWAGRLLAGGKGHSGRVIFAIALHNLPQGMAVGLTGALALTGDPNTVAGAVALSLGIGLQNIPEGVAVAFPVRQAGASKAKAFAVGTASGLVEPLGAALGGALAGSLLGAMPWLLSLAAGTMVCVTAQELIPQAAEDGKAGIFCVVLGFAIMMALDVALG